MLNLSQSPISLVYAVLRSISFYCLRLPLVADNPLHLLGPVRSKYNYALVPMCDLFHELPTVLGVVRPFAAFYYRRVNHHFQMARAVLAQLDNRTRNDPKDTFPDNFTGAWVNNGIAKTPTSSSTMHPIDHVIAKVHRICIFVKF
jgi:hypothetical protein